MKLTLNITDSMVDRVITAIMYNYPEAGRSNTLMCEDYNYSRMTFQFIDTESGKHYGLTLPLARKAFPLIYSDKWPKGCTQPPTANLNAWETWDNWLCDCDVTDHDAFVQLVCLGEVSFG